MYITSGGLSFYRSQLYHILSQAQGSKKHTLQVNTGTDEELFGLEEETGREFQWWSLYSSHRATGSHLQVWRWTTQTLALIFPTWAVSHSPHQPNHWNCPVHWYFSRAGLFSHLPSDWCLQSSNFPLLSCSCLFSRFHYEHFWNLCNQFTELTKINFN